MLKDDLQERWRPSVAKSVAEASKHTASASSQHRGEDFTSILIQMFTALDLDEPAATCQDTEADDHYNRLVSNFNLRSYFDQAESMLEPSWPKRVPEAKAKSPSEKFLNYVVPGKPHFESDQAKALYFKSHEP